LHEFFGTETNDVFEKFIILTLKFRNKKGKNQGKSEFFVNFLRFFCDFHRGQHERHGFATRMEREIKNISRFIRVMRKILLPLLLLFALPRAEDEEVVAEIVESEYSSVPLSYAFDGILLNSGKTLSHNYGLNSALMVSGTSALIKTGKDWEWNRFAYRHKPITEVGMHAYYIGFAVPFVAPVSIYGLGFALEDSKLQTAGLATAQATIISTAFSSTIKAFTGRKHSDVWDGKDEDYSGDFAFGFMKRSAFAGWPSGHSSSAWAMAATLTEFYPDNIPLAAGLYGYAVYISASASVSFHWLSDVCAGSLFGYTIGKTVGKHFTGGETPFSIVVLPNRVMIVFPV
jgi:membrane-associated PAP2 superfamily phosphatase